MRKQVSIMYTASPYLCPALVIGWLCFPKKRPWMQPIVFATAILGVMEALQRFDQYNLLLWKALIIMGMVYHILPLLAVIIYPTKEKMPMQTRIKILVAYLGLGSIFVSIWGWVFDKWPYLLPMRVMMAGYALIGVCYVIA